MGMNNRLMRPVASGLNPKTIVGLSLWLDGSDSSTITLNGANVSEWRDKSGTGAPAAAQSTAASQPAYNASGVNGRGTVDFDATESLVFGSSTASFNYLHNATGATIFVAWKPDATSNPDDSISAEQHKQLHIINWNRRLLTTAQACRETTE
ncbi:MAG: hypothetical protein EBQ89_00760 [Alphaproteobacteria bacterium]|nr:hypothetical protein [Alphaproteobacteria bacterium]